MNQVHTKFKLFTKKFSSKENLSGLFEEIEKWVKESKIAPKSIGVEFIESSNMVLMSVGYSDNESYSVKFKSSLVNKIDLNADFKAVEQEMAKTSSLFSNIICHELFVTNTNEFHMVFMIKE